MSFMNKYIDYNGPEWWETNLKIVILMSNVNYLTVQNSEWRK